LWDNYSEVILLQFSIVHILEKVIQNLIFFTRRILFSLTMINIILEKHNDYLFNDNYCYLLNHFPLGIIKSKTKHIIWYIFYIFVFFESVHRAFSLADMPHIYFCLLKKSHLLIIYHNYLNVFTQYLMLNMFIFLAEKHLITWLLKYHSIFFFT
jgi:hypothetical protein